MGWWEYISDLDNLVDRIYDDIWDRIHYLVDNVAQYWIRRADETYSILKKSWYDVTNYVDNKLSYYYNSIDDFYYSLCNKLENSYSILEKSWSNIVSEIDSRINNALYGYYNSINDFYSTLCNKLENSYSILEKSWSNIVSEIDSRIQSSLVSINYKINSISEDIDDINDALDIVSRTALEIVNYISNEAEKRWGILKKSWTEVTNLVNSKINTFKSNVVNPVINDVSNLKTNVNNIVNVTIKNINTNISNLTTNLTKLKSDVVNPLVKKVDGIKNTIDNYPSWIVKSWNDLINDIIETFITVFTSSQEKSVRFLTSLGIGAGEIITTILDTPKDMVAWIKNDIADVFEDILDRVFK
jgi:phage-related protein